MCGIGGVLSAQPDQRVDPQLLVNMAAIQVHRGPDGFGVETLDDAGVGFCHARLSIIDLDENRARQPFLTDDGQVLMAHNGEFYDFQRIRADLTAETILKEPELATLHGAAAAPPPVASALEMPSLKNLVKVLVLNLCW